MFLLVTAQTAIFKAESFHCHLKLKNRLKVDFVPLSSESLNNFNVDRNFCTFSLLE